MVKINCWIVFFLLFLFIFPVQASALYYDSYYSPYGINVSNEINFWLYIDESEYLKMAEQIAKSGIRWVKIWVQQEHFDPYVDPNEKTVPIEKLDKLCRAFLNEGLRLVGLVRLPRSPDFENFYPNGLRSDWPKWENFLRYITHRYGPNDKAWINIWGIENEVDISSVFYKSLSAEDEVDIDESLYLEFIKGSSEFAGSYSIVKEENPQATIFSSPWTSLNLDPGQVTDRWLSQGLCNYFDIFAINIYEVTTSEVEIFFNKAVALLDQYPDCTGKQIWFTETNQGTCATPEEAADEIAFRYQRFIELGAGKIFWFNVVDGPNLSRGLFSESCDELDPDDPDYTYDDCMGYLSACIAPWRYWPHPPNPSYYSLKNLALNYTLPSAPVITSPAANESFTSANITVNWQPAINGSFGISQYLVQLTSADDPYFFNPLIYRVIAPAESLLLENIGETTYLIRVKAIDNNHNHGPWSKIVNFKIEAKPGDANGDGLTNLADFLIWTNYYRQSDSTSPSSGDFNHDSKTNTVDFGIWLKAYLP